MHPNFFKVNIKTQESTHTEEDANQQDMPNTYYVQTKGNGLHKVNIKMQNVRLFLKEI